MKVRFYKLINQENDDVYVGSTTQTLHDRFRKMCSQEDTRAFDYRLMYPECSIVLLSEWEMYDKYCEERYIVEQYYIDYVEGNKWNDKPAWNPDYSKQYNRKYKEEHKERLLKKDRERAVCPKCGVEKMKRYIKYHLQKGCEKGRKMKPRVN